MANILTGYGKPSVLLPGVKGQIYEDLDTGKLYECKGERGFIRVDGDDQDNQFNWVLKGVDISYSDLQDKPEQGGSTGGGVFTVNFTKTGSNVTCDKTFEEIIGEYVWKGYVFSRKILQLRIKTFDDAFHKLRG